MARGNKLTERQKAFADYYIELGNATKAARKAGYSAKYINTNANKLLQNTTIKKYMGERLKEVDSKRIARVEEVLEYYTSVMRGETLSEIVVVEGIGDGCSKARKIQKKPDEKEKLRAAELLGKRYGIFKEDTINTEAPTVVIVNKFKK